MNEEKISKIASNNRRGSLLEKLRKQESRHPLLL